MNFQYNRYVSIPLFILLLICGMSKIHAQNIESIVKADPVVMSGGFSFDQLLSYSTASNAQNTQPYQYFLSANATAVLFGQITLPFSISYTNKKFNTKYPFNQQPFNRFGMSPSYKWVTVHAGWRSMNFGKYSLSGHSFLGGGLELSPGDFNVKIMYGRLLKAVKPDSSMSTGNLPCYERWGSGVALGYSHNGSKYGFSVFRSADEAGSLEENIDSLGIYPEENFLFSVSVDQKMGEKLSLSVEYGNSRITNDSRIGEREDSFVTDNLFIYENSSTKVYHAIKGDLSYKLSSAQIGLGYERVDPDYRSHGAYFYSNDFQNITVNLSVPLFDKKLTTSGSIGVENDNLNKTKTNTSTRIVGSVALGYSVNEKLQFNASYSNFNSVSEFNKNVGSIMDSPYDSYDSLTYAQISQNGSINTAYTFGKDSVQQSLNAAIALTQTNSEIGGQEQNTGMTFYNGNVAYSCNMLEYQLGMSLGVNLSWSDTELDDSGMLGPTASLSKSFFNGKLSSSVNYAYNTQLGGSSNNGDVHSVSISNRLSLGKVHSISLQATWVNRPIYIASGLYEIADKFTGRLTYVLKLKQYSLIKNKKKRNAKKEKSESE